MNDLKLIPNSHWHDLLAIATQNYRRENFSPAVYFGVNRRLNSLCCRNAGALMILLGTGVVGIGYEWIFNPWTLSTDSRSRRLCMGRVRQSQGRLWYVVVCFLLLVRRIGCLGAWQFPYVDLSSLWDLVFLYSRKGILNLISWPTSSRATASCYLNQRDVESSTSRDTLTPMTSSMEIKRKQLDGTKHIKTKKTEYM